jgi:hypothetical protein
MIGYSDGNAWSQDRSYCSEKCYREWLQQKHAKGTGPIIINNSGSGSSGTFSDLLDAGIDIATSIHAAKQAKRAAKERAGMEAEKRKREYWNSPEVDFTPFGRHR